MLGAKAFDVLCALIERRERLVTKDELLELVWPNWSSRKTTCRCRSPRYARPWDRAIATIPGRGYRFALELSPAGEPPRRLKRAGTTCAPLTSFVGHEDDLTEYVDLLGRVGC